MSKRQERPRRTSHSTQKLPGLHNVKAQFLQLLSSLDPVAALHHLHYAGLVRDTDSDLKETQTATKDTRYLGGHQKQHQDEAVVARKKLEELADEHVELHTVVTALEAFLKLRDKVHQQAEDKIKLLPTETSVEDDKVSRRTSIHEIQLLGAFEQCTHGHDELCDLLEEKKDLCNVSEIANFEGKTLLHLACCMMLLETVEALVSKYNCNPNTQDSDGNTPLHEASRCRKVQIAKYLASLPSCDPNIQNNNGDTPLHVALAKQHWGLSRELFKSGRIDLSIKNNKGYTVIRLLDRHPHSTDHIKMKKILQRSASMASLGSLGSQLSQRQSSLSDESNDNVESSGRRISFGEDTTAHFKKKAPTSTAIQVTGKRLASGSKPRSGKRGILRPYDPSAIRTSKVSIRMEDIDDKMEMEGEEFVSEYPKLEIKQHWTVIAYNVCRLLIQVGFLFFALLLCIALLSLLVVYIVKSPDSTV